MAGTERSPPTTACWRGRSGASAWRLRQCGSRTGPGTVLLPSTSKRPGLRLRLATARLMASKVACRMLMRSMVAGQITPSPQARAHWRIRGARCSRLAALRALESVRPGRSYCSGRMTAAATTGPARQPRPASSMPAMSRGREGGAQSRPCSGAGTAEDRLRRGGTVFHSVAETTKTSPRARQGEVRSVALLPGHVHRTLRPPWTFRRAADQKRPRGLMRAALPLRARR